MKRKKQKDKYFEKLPGCAAEFIRLVIKKMRYRKKVRADVAAELAAHFEDELHDCQTDKEKEQKAGKIIEDFGDVKLLAALIRRAKKRCRPLWQTTIIRFLQATGTTVVLLVIYIAWFLSGKPAITVDYVDELNRLVRTTDDTSLNAASLYYEAAKLYVDEPNDTYEWKPSLYKDMTFEQKQVVDNWLVDNEKVLKLVDKGTQKPYYWPKYEGEDMSSILESFLPYQSKFRRFARMLRWRAWQSIEKGQYKDALQDTMSCYRLGRHLRGNKTLIEQINGMSIESLATKTLYNIVSKKELDPALLDLLQKEYETIIYEEDFTISLKAEKLSMKDEIQRCFTEGGFSGGHLYAQRMIDKYLQKLKYARDFVEGVSEDPLYKDNELYQKLKKQLLWHRILFSSKLWSSSLRGLFIHPNKEQTMQTFDRYWEFWENIFSKSPAQIHSEAIDVEKESMKIIKGNFLLETLVPALGRVNEVSHRLVTDVRATLTIIATLRYRLDNGQVPDTLEELVTKGYLKELSIDSFSDKPLVYKKTEDNFLLYSVGTNFTDDGGEIFRDEKGKIKRYADEGDWVFWPAPKN